VLQSGVQRLYEVTLSNGLSIKATANHRHLTPDGYRMVSELEVGDHLVVDAGYQMPTPEETSLRMRLTRGERQEWGTINGAEGKDNWGYIDGGSAFHTAWKRDNPRVCRECGCDDPAPLAVQVAHLDGNHWNNVEGNLAWLCQPCHFKYDYANNSRRRRWEKGHLVGSFPIVSIVDVGEEMTYDVVMDEPHNFVANGIVTHNSFNKSHAVSYAILAFYCLWYRVHYPEEFFTAVLSTLSDSASKQRVPDFVAEAQRLGFKVLPPDINTSGKGFTASEMAVRYGFGQIKGIGPKVVDVLVDQQPYASVEDFRAKMAGHRVNMGHVRTLAAVGAFDAMEPNRRGLEAALAAEADGTSSVCVDRTADRADGALPCRYDWANEPVELTAKGKAKIRKVPARCTKACRHYRPGGFSITEVDPYTDAEVRDLEMERLGVWLSSSPFDRITDELWKDLVDVPGLQKALPGVYHMPGVLKAVRKHQDSAGRPMAFLQVLVKNDVIDVVAFSSTWSAYGAVIQPGKLGIYEIAHKGRDQRGVQLRAFSAVD
jgi:hypothetical protein